MDGVKRPFRYVSELWDHFGVLATCGPIGGDLIFFSRHGRYPTHVGIVGADGVSYIEAPGKTGTFVSVSAIERKPVPTPERLDRILYHTNPIGYKVLTQPHDPPSSRWHQQLVP